MVQISNKVIKNPLTGTVLPILINEPVTVLCIIWEGATSQGDTCRIDHIGGGLLWEGIAVSAQTYIGVNLGPEGIESPNGIEVVTLESGRIFIYFLED